MGLCQPCVALRPTSLVSTSVIYLMANSPKSGKQYNYYAVGYVRSVQNQALLTDGDSWLHAWAAAGKLQSPTEVHLVCGTHSATLAADRKRH